jgi:ADP-ribosylglycohydrolase
MVVTHVIDPRANGITPHQPGIVGVQQIGRRRYSRHILDTSRMNLQSKFRGAMLGLAVGDAVGTTLEFKSPGSFKKIDDTVGGGPFHLSAGEWTDDTSMALCLAESLIEKQRVRPDRPVGAIHAMGKATTSPMSDPNSSTGRPVSSARLLWG